MVTRSHATNSLNILLFKQSPLWPASSPQFRSYFLESTTIGYSSSKPSICITELLLLVAIAPLPLSTWEHARTVFLLHISSNLLTISFISRPLVLPPFASETYEELLLVFVCSRTSLFWESVQTVHPLLTTQFWKPCLHFRGICSNSLPSSLSSYHLHWHSVAITGTFRTGDLFKRERGGGGFIDSEFKKSITKALTGSVT